VWLGLESWGRMWLSLSLDIYVFLAILYRQTHDCILALWAAHVQELVRPADVLTGRRVAFGSPRPEMRWA
jgi:hypothetical protein